jgi:hypothetical protein
MTDELLELDRLRADLPPADQAAMARARATLVHTATSAGGRSSVRRFPKRIATMAMVGAAAAVAFVIVPGAGDNAPTASAVTLNDDGTVTIELTDLADMPAANKVLEDAGIRAELISLEDRGTCEPGTEPAQPLPEPGGLVVDHPRNERNILIFRPDQIPAGAELVVFGAVGSLIYYKGEVVPVVWVWVSGKLYPENSGTCVDTDLSPLNDIFVPLR